jgi:ferritin-like metal-binding protein YciE
MGIFSKSIKTMDDLFVHTLQDIYYAEKKLVTALADLIGKADDQDLKAALSEHRGETLNHVARVEEVFYMHGSDPKTTDCPAIDGIIKEASEIAGDVEDKHVLDAAIIAAAQAAEHYEITRYGTLVAWAKELGRQDCASILEENLEEEKAADRKLTALAEAEVNVEATS